MELRHLRYFLAVAKHQGFRKAAQALPVSHPSLCEQIIDLESEIDTRLFERTNHHISLTAAGHTFVAGARRTLACARQAVASAQQASRDYRGELRIANVGLMCPSLLAHLIGAFRQRLPMVEFPRIASEALPDSHEIPAGNLCSFQPHFLRMVGSSFQWREE
jgi:DNA-binding transcriptional LysR family regulator